SRNRLSSLVAVDGAHPLMLDLLTPDEARELLARRLGPDRLAAEPDGVQQIIACCARLPLALTIAAALAEQSGFPLATLAAGRARPPNWAEPARRWGVLPAGDPGGQLRAVFPGSSAARPPAAPGLFGLLALPPGPDIPPAAAARPAPPPPAETRRLLAELTRS